MVTEDKKQTLDERFDRFTKEKKIFNLLITALLYVLYYSAVDINFAVSVLYIKSRTMDLLYFDKICLPAIIFITAATMLIPKKPQLVFTGVLGLFLTVYSFAQCVVMNTNSTLIRLNAVFYAKEAGDFAGGAISEVPVGVIVSHGLLVILLAVVLFISARIERPEMGKVYKRVYYGLCSVLLIAGFIPSCFYSYFRWGNSVETSYEKFNYDNILNPFSTFMNCDYYTYNLNDIKLMITDKLFSQRNTKEIDEYFEGRNAPESNEMTGTLKGKNLIIIQLESLDFRPVEAGFCPNIENLMKESIVFDNYYAVRYGNTLTFGSETSLNTSLTASSGINLSNLDDHSFPYSLASMFSGEGYSCVEYHANTGAFYNRTEMSKAYGYEEYICASDIIGSGDAFNDADLVSDEKAFGEMFKKESPFVSYYISFTPHEKMFDTIEDTYPDIAKAKHPEFAELPKDKVTNWMVRCTLSDDMVGLLMEKLEQNGILDNTAVLFVNDHISITNSDSVYNDDNNLCNRVPCFLYCKGMEPQVVEKPCTQVDLLPTLLNLYGIDYGNHYFGLDIFSDDEGFVYFPDMSWITDTCYYEKGSVREVFSEDEDFTVSEEYIEKMNEEVMNRVKLNNMILCSDYFAKSDK